jgi:DNA-binding CsgD family transcriptional regulator
LVVAPSPPTKLCQSLIGREPESAQIARLVEDARNHESGSLVLRGEPGIGKTALLDYAADHAKAFTVLRATGVSSESDLPFAGLYGLLRPIINGLGRLPVTQSEALATALGLARTGEHDRFLVSAAVLSLLAAAAEDQPVLCVVDDAQWLDRPSSDALVFTARRLRGDRVAMLFGAREGERRHFDAPGLPELLLGGVDHDSAERILELGSPPAAARVRTRLLAEAAGNPLALIELPGALNDAQLAGHEPLPDAIPLTPRLQSLFLRRAEDLPDDVRTTLLLCAADSTGEVATILRAAEQLQLSSELLDPAEHRGLIRTTGGRISFRHPLVRTALYDAAPLSKRQLAHSALAAALTGDEHTDRRVWHQAMAAVTGDEQVATALETSARSAQQRAAHASAATAYQRAAELTRDETRLAPRLTGAAEAAWNAGQPDRALELIVRARRFADTSLSARLLHLRGVIELRVGRTRDALPTLLEAAEASTDPSLVLEILLEAAEAAADAGDPATVAKIGGRAAQLSTQNARDEFKQSVLLGFASRFAGENEAARTSFGKALELASTLRDPRSQIWAAQAASVGFDLGQGLPYANRAVELARGEGLLSILPLALTQQSLELLWNSRLDLAYAAAEEGYQLSLDVGYGREWHLTTMLGVEAIQGRETEAREHADAVIALAQTSGETFLITTARAALALLELALGRPDHAADALLAIVSPDRKDVSPIVAIAAVPDAIEAVLRADRSIDLVDDAFGRFRTWVDQAPTDGYRSLLARCQALLGKRPAEEAFDEAVRLAPGLSQFQRARTELLYGEWLRRQRRRIDARVHLRSAVELFHLLGAIPWELRAEAELRASGETARKREPSTWDQLTPQELHISELVAEGMSNREIAAQLYLSPHTIEYHLRKVFAKLAITSRTDLMRERATSGRQADPHPAAPGTGLLPKQGTGQ